VHNARADAAANAAHTTTPDTAASAASDTYSKNNNNNNNSSSSNNNCKRVFVRQTYSFTSSSLSFIANNTETVVFERSSIVDNTASPAISHCNLLFRVIFLK
jgi:hypothetical protein